jgi:hypothetical protein
MILIVSGSSCAAWSIVCGVSVYLVTALTLCQHTTAVA